VFAPITSVPRIATTCDFNLQGSFYIHLRWFSRGERHLGDCLLHETESFKFASSPPCKSSSTMKFAPAFALLVASASAFTAPSMTFAVGKKSATKVVKKAAPKPKPVAKKAPPKKAVVSSVRHLWTSSAGSKG
jgi:hypothetical protein